MAFINGKFYANPTYGRAVERARSEEGAPGDQEKEAADSDGHWVTINGRHVLISDAQDAQKGTDDRRESSPGTIRLPSNESERRLAVIVFNETGGLTSTTKSGKGSNEDLHNARVAVAEISKRAIETGHPLSVAPDEIQTGLWKGLNSHDPASISAWNESLEAAKTALAGSSTAEGASQFRLDPKNGRIPTWAMGRTPSHTYGPFHNAGGGDAATPATRIYVYH